MRLRPGYPTLKMKFELEARWGERGRAAPKASRPHVKLSQRQCQSDLRFGYKPPLCFRGSLFFFLSSAAFPGNCAFNWQRVFPLQKEIFSKEASSRPLTNYKYK